MPSKTSNNPIRKGLISKIYLVAYCSRKNLYRIAEAIYETEISSKKIASKSGTISRYCKKYSYLFDKNEQGILSKSEYLFDELIKEMEANGIILDENEKETFYKFLDGDFRIILCIRLAKKDWRKKEPFEVFKETLRDIFMVGGTLIIMINLNNLICQRIDRGVKLSLESFRSVNIEELKRGLEISRRRYLQLIEDDLTELERKGVIDSDEKRHILSQSEKYLDFREDLKKMAEERGLYKIVNAVSQFNEATIRKLLNFFLGESYQIFTFFENLVYLLFSDLEYQIGQSNEGEVWKFNLLRILQKGVNLEEKTEILQKLGILERFRISPEVFKKDKSMRLHIYKKLRESSEIKSN